METSRVYDLVQDPEVGIKHRLAHVALVKDRVDILFQWLGFSL